MRPGKRGTRGTARRPRRSVHADLLHRTRGFADGIAALFFPYAEVVIHALATQTIAYIANNLSRREVGDDSALENADFGNHELLVGPYEKRNWDGGTMRSVSIVIRGPRSAPIGLACINLNISVFKQAASALTLLATGARTTAQPQILFRDDWQERINTFIHGWLHARQLALAALTREQKRLLVRELYAQGAFGGRSAAAYIARVIGMGRATVFKHVKDLKGGAAHTR